MEVIAFFLLFAVTNYAVTGGKKKSDQPAAASQSAEPFASAIFADLGRKAVTRMHTIGIQTPSNEDTPCVPSELTQTRNWDEYITPSYRRR